MPSALDNFLETVERNAALDADVALAPSPRTLAGRSAPRALVLPVVVCICECGHVTRNINPSVIVRYDDRAQEGTVHFTRRTLSRYGFLPREVKELRVNVPFCEQCFMPNVTVERNASPQRNSTNEPAANPNSRYPRNRSDAVRR